MEHGMQIRVRSGVILARELFGAFNIRIDDRRKVGAGVSGYSLGMGWADHPAADNAES
jgi:hypothetical protein